MGPDRTDPSSSATKSLNVLSPRVSLSDPIHNLGQVPAIFWPGYTT
jgi:hypothetical protein